MAETNRTRKSTLVHNLTGKVFGRLTVVSFAETRNKKRLWRCRCECGTERIVGTQNLVCGMAASCGCLRKDAGRARILSLAGQCFGRLTVIAQADNAGRRVQWLCRCECGHEKIVIGEHLTSGKTASCGCIQPKHGHSHRAIYNAWKTMIGRCENVNHSSFPKYGARGIHVCERWHDFINFLADMGERPAGMSIDRIDNDGNYEPSNCRWATASEQQRNKRNTRPVGE